MGPPPATPAAFTTPSSRPCSRWIRSRSDGDRRLVGHVERLDARRRRRCRRARRCRPGPRRVGGGPADARCRTRDHHDLVVERCHVQNDRKCSTVQSRTCPYRAIRQRTCPSRSEMTVTSDRAPTTHRYPRTNPRCRRGGRTPFRVASGVDGRGRRAGSGLARAASIATSPTATRSSPRCCAEPRDVSSRAARPRSARRTLASQVAEAAVFIREHMRDPSLTLPALGDDDALLATLLAAHVDGLVAEWVRVLATLVRGSRGSRRDPRRPRPP